MDSFQGTEAEKAQNFRGFSEKEKPLLGAVFWGGARLGSVNISEPYVITSTDLAGIEELQFISAIAAVGFVSDIDALNKERKAIKHFELSACVPLLVLLVIGGLRYTTCEVSVSPVIGCPDLEAIALIKQDDVSRIAEAR